MHLLSIYLTRLTFQPLALILLSLCQASFFPSLPHFFLLSFPPSFPFHSKPHRVLYLYRIQLFVSSFLALFSPLPSLSSFSFFISFLVYSCSVRYTGIFFFSTYLINFLSLSFFLASFLPLHSSLSFLSTPPPSQSFTARQVTEFLSSNSVPDPLSSFPSLYSNLPFPPSFLTLIPFFFPYFFPLSFTSFLSMPKSIHISTTLLTPPYIYTSPFPPFLSSFLSLSSCHSTRHT